MANIKDVAKKAGVSIATVSRYLNHRGVVSERTGGIITQAMEELDYSPNEMARGLKQQKSHMIGVVVPEIGYEYFGRLLDAMENKCEKMGYRIILCRSGEKEEREQEMIRLLKSSKVDGMILCSRLGHTEQYEKLNLPVVSIDRRISGIPLVSSDNYSGGRLAAQALIAAGARKMIIVSGMVPDYVTMSRRIPGFAVECIKNNIRCDYMNIPDSATLALGKRIHEIAMALADKKDTDGIFFTGDMIAARVVLDPVFEKEREHFHIISYDGLRIADIVHIDAIVQPIEEIGETSVELLLQIMDGKDVPKENILPVSLKCYGGY